MVFATTAIDNTGIFFQQLENGVTLGAIYALVALGYTLVYGILELINFAHGDVFMWGTVATVTLVNALGITSQLTGFALVGVMLLLITFSMLVSGGLNVAIERLAYRRLRRSPRLAPLIAAIGVSFVLQNLAQLYITQHYHTSDPEHGFPKIFPIGGYSIGSVHINYIDIFIVVMAAGFMYGLDRFIQKTKLGKAMRATAQDPEAAALMGVNIDRTIVYTFLIGGALAGAAAVVYNMYGASIVRFDTGFRLGLYAFTAAVLGGIGNIYGAVLGGFVIGLVQAMTTQYFPFGNGSEWSRAAVFAVLVMILVFRPSGLLGQQSPDKV